MRSDAENGSSHEELVRKATELSKQYDLNEHGFCVSPGPLLTPNELALVREHAERVLAGVYETGVAPRTNSGGPDVESHPPYIEAQMPQDADDVIAAIIKSPRIAEWAAKISGAKRLKVWSAQVMKKYPTQDGKASIVGWHQDRHYVEKIMKGQSINVWIALDDVPEERGPVRYVPRSNRWDRKYDTGFFDRDHDRQRSEIEIPEGETWEEVAAVLPAGWAVAHPTATLHGSSGNVSDKVRLNLLVDLGVDDFELLPDTYFATRASDERASPIIYEA
jgi:ectoine hydroxylase-related dioxygenase (phytanoyl-CoA dioxygenase family)